MAANTRIDIFAVRHPSVRQAVAETRALDRNATALNRNVGTLNQRLGAFRNVVNTAFAATVVLGFGAALARVSDTFTNIRSRVRLVVGETQRLADVQNMVREVALRTRTAYEDTARLFSRIAIAGRDAGVSIMETLQITETFNQALIVSGASVQEQASAITQFSQAFASGVLQGEELRALRESAPLVATAFAEALGGGIEDLKAFAEEGLITRDVMRRALRGMASDVMSQFALVQRTIAQSLTNLRTEFTEFIGQFNDATGAASIFADAIQLMADNVANLVSGLSGLATTAGATLLLRLFGLGATAAGGVAAVLGSGVQFTALLAGEDAARERLRVATTQAQRVVGAGDAATPEQIARAVQDLRDARSDAEAFGVQNRIEGFFRSDAANQFVRDYAEAAQLAETLRPAFARQNSAIIAQQIGDAYRRAAFEPGAPVRPTQFTGTPQGLTPTQQRLIEARNLSSFSALSDRDQFIVSNAGVETLQELNDLIALGDEEARQLRDTLGQAFDSQQAREYNEVLQETLGSFEEANDVRALRLSGQEREAEILVRINQLRRDGIRITDDVRARVEAGVDRQLQLDEQAESLMRIQQVSQSVSRNIEDAFLSSADSIGDRFRNLASGIISDLSRIGIRRFITNPLAGALFGQAGGGTGSGLLGGFFGGLGGNQEGGYYEIPPGAGGGDRSVFATRISSGEGIQVFSNRENTGNGQSRGGGITQNLTINLPDVFNVDSFVDSSTQVERTASGFFGGTA